MGTKYPKGKTPQYPPRDWTCPICKKYHTNPHYAFPGQIDLSKEPEEIGRVVFGREDKNGCDDMKNPLEKIKKVFSKKKTGDQFKNNRGQRPLFCPHCGWLDEVINIIKVTN